MWLLFFWLLLHQKWSLISSGSLEYLLFPMWGRICAINKNPFKKSLSCACYFWLPVASCRYCSLLFTVEFSTRWPWFAMPVTFFQVLWLSASYEHVLSFLVTSLIVTWVTSWCTKPPAELCLLLKKLGILFVPHIGEEKPTRQQLSWLECVLVKRSISTFKGKCI